MCFENVSTCTLLLRQAILIHVVIPKNDNYPDTGGWIESYFDLEFTSRLIICGYKNLIQGDFLIDDHLQGKGQESFTGQVLQYGSDKFPNWQEISNFFANHPMGLDCK